MKILKFIAKQSLTALGVEVRRAPRAARLLANAAGHDPLSFQYCADMQLKPTLTMKLSDARAGITGYAYNPDSAHPLIAASRAAIRSETRESAEASVREILAEYYNQVRPESALEVVGLGADEAPGLVGIPLHHWTLPWSELDPAQTGRQRRTCLEEEGLARRTLVSIEDGSTHYGPVSDRKLALETTRVADLVASFHASGFRPSAASPIDVVGLRVGTEYRWFVVQGHHRLAVCTAFGIDAVSARVVRIVRREDVQYWPGVVGAAFAAPGALKLFDRIWAGEALDSASRWIEAQRDMKAGSGQSTYPRPSIVAA